MKRGQSKSGRNVRCVAALAHLHLVLDGRLLGNRPCVVVGVGVLDAGKRPRDKLNDVVVVHQVARRGCEMATRCGSRRSSGEQW